MENAAPTGIGSGVHKHTKASELSNPSYVGDDVMCKVHVPSRRRYSIRLADGWPMVFTCDPDGLVSAYDFACADGRILRIERRIVTIMPSLDPEGTT